MRMRLAFVLWVCGMPGVVVVTLALVRQMPPLPEPVPIWVVPLAGMVPSALLLGVASAVGVRLAPLVGLEAVGFAALADRPSRLHWPRAGVLPALLGGVIGSAVIVAFQFGKPESLAPLDAAPVLPLVARVLYGGITEEILLRWGWMTFLVWLGWRTVQRGRGRPSPAVVWVAIAASAVTFGAAHLPAVAAVVGVLTMDAVAYVVVANAAFGLIAGWLFLRYGLEASIGAHMLAHVGAAAVLSLLGS